MAGFSGLLLSALAFVLVTAAAEQIGGAYLTYTLPVYVHLRSGGSAPTEVTVALYNNTFGFGALLVADDYISAGSDITSDAVGRVKGIGGNTDQSNLGQNSSLYLTFLISYQGINGTVVIIGTSVRSDTVRPFAIVGGTGDFVLAKGFATQEKITSVVNADGSSNTTNLWTLTLYYDLYTPPVAKLAAANWGSLERIPALQMV